MEIGTLLGALAFGAAGLYFVKHSVRLFRPQVWVRTDAQVIGADVTGSRAKGIAGVAMGGAMAAFAVCMATLGPEGFALLIERFLRA